MNDTFGTRQWTWRNVTKNCAAYGAGYYRRGCVRKSALSQYERDPAEKPESIRYDVPTMIEAAEAWIEANREYHMRARSLLDSDQSRGEYWKADAVQSALYDGLKNLCKAVGASPSDVLAIVRSFRRYSQYRRGWDFVAEWHMGNREHDSFRRCVQRESAA